MNQDKMSFTDYLSVVLKWKKFFLINFILIALITTGITFLITEKFKSKAVIMLTDENEMGGLSGALSNVGSLFGSVLMGSGGAQIDKIFGYLESTSLRQEVIDKFDLIKYYEIEKYKHDKTLKFLKEDLQSDLTDNGFIEITMIHQSPDTSAAIINFLIERLDEMNRDLIFQNATNYRKFIEKRYLKNIQDLEEAQIEMEKFQIEYGVYVIPEQFQVAFEAIGKLEAELFSKDLQLEIIQETQGINSIEHKLLEKEIFVLKNNLRKIRNGEFEGEKSIVFLPQKDLPKIYKNYFNIYREIEIQGKLMEFILPMYEQAMMEEQKNIPTIVVVDKAVPPELKYSPKKSFIIISILFVVSILLILFILRSEYIFELDHQKNQFQRLENKFYDKISKIYKLRFSK